MGAPGCCEHRGDTQTTHGVLRHVWGEHCFDVDDITAEKHLHVDLSPDSPRNPLEEPDVGTKPTDGLRPPMNGCRDLGSCRHDCCRRGGHTKGEGPSTTDRAHVRTIGLQRVPQEHKPHQQPHGVQPSSRFASKMACRMGVPELIPQGHAVRARIHVMWKPTCKYYF